MNHGGATAAPAAGGHGEHASPWGSRADEAISASRAPDGHGAPTGQDGADNGADQTGKGSGKRARASEPYEP